MLSKYLNCFLLGGLFLLSFTALTAQNCTGNLVNNSGFEQGISGWNVVFGNANVSSDANSGSSAIELGGSTGDHLINQAFAGKPNTEYTLRAFLKKNNSDNRAVYVQIRYFNASWQQLPTSRGVFNNNVYTEEVVTGTSPANTAYVGVEFSYQPRNASDVVVIDDVCFVEGTGISTGGCSIAANVTDESCDDNGTAALFDDVSSATIMVNNGGASGSYTASYRVGATDYSATGTYGTPLTITDIQSVSFGNATISVEIRDNTNNNCLTTTSFVIKDACSTPNPGACGLTVDVTNSVCNNNGTPNNTDDDFYSATVTVNHPSGSFFGAEISYMLGNQSKLFILDYGVPFNINNISIKDDGSLSLLVVDRGDPDCFLTRSTTAPQSCSTGGPTGGSGADLELIAISTATNIPAWSNATVKFTLTNNGTSPASNINVGLNIDDDAKTRGGNEYTASQGTLASFWTTNPTWQVGTLAPGQSATIDLNLFTLSANEIPIYGQVSSVTGNDPDSTPGNGSCCTANEDDEAVFNINGNNNPPPPPSGGGNANIFGLSASSANPAVGSTFTANVTLKNVSFDLSTNDVQVRFQLPAGVTFAPNPFTAQKGTYANGVWSVGTLDGNESTSITFNLVRNTPNTFPLTATIISGATGGNTTETINIQGSTPPPGGGNANIIGVSPSSGDPAVGSAFTTSVSLKNQSFSLPANNVQVRFQLPAGTSFASIPFSTQVGSYANGVWNVGTLDGNGSATITFNLIRNTTNAITFTAEVISGATGGNTIESVTIPALNPPPSGGGNANIFGLSASSSNPSQWSFFTSTVTVKNVSFSTPANDVKVKFELPNGVTFKGGDEFTASQGSYSLYGDNVWNVGTLAGNESATITFNLFRITANSFSLTADITSGATGGNTSETITIGAAARGVNSRSAVIGNMPNEPFAITNAYPNPTLGTFKIDVYSNEEKISELTVLDILGKPVYQQEVNLVKGINTIPVNLESAAPGFLTIQMTPFNKNLRQIRVMKITD